MQLPQDIHGHIPYPETDRHPDYLFRVSLKAVIINPEGKLLLVKESAREYWDVPGGGLDHGETIKEALTREIFEEVGYDGKFSHEVLRVEEPGYLDGFNFYQMRIVFLVKPEHFDFKVGQDSDEIKFVDAKILEKSQNIYERKLFEYSEAAKSHL
jgi:8-oxo-dGTP pyrophosphatase MutT (NUDIX family)